MQARAARRSDAVPSPAGPPRPSKLYGPLPATGAGTAR